MKVRIALATLAGVAAMAMTGVATTAASASASIPPTPAPVAHQPPGCDVGQLSAALSLPRVKGHEYSYVLTLTNISHHHACTVSGYPGLQLLSAFRLPIPTKTIEVKRAFHAPEKIVLPPGRSATAEISFTVYGAPSGRHPHGMPFPWAKAVYLKVTLPGFPEQGRPGEPHHWLPAQYFTLRIPGGPVRVVHNQLFETALAGHLPVFPW